MSDTQYPPVIIFEVAFHKDGCFLDRVARVWRSIGSGAVVMTCYYQIPHERCVFGFDEGPRRNESSCWATAVIKASGPAAFSIAAFTIFNTCWGTSRQPDDKMMGTSLQSLRMPSAVSPP